MADLRDNNSSKELLQVQTNDEVVDKEEADSGIHIPAGCVQANDDEILVDIPPEIDSRCIYRVPPHLHASRKQVYDPVVLSIGPYHHGDPRFSQMENIKEMELEKFISENQLKDLNKGQDFFYGKIMENIDSIRKNYESVECNDMKLAEIILRDACFLIRYFGGLTRSSFSMTCDAFGGLTTLPLIWRDLCMLENQIPFWIIKHLIHLSSGEDKADELLHEFVWGMYFPYFSPTIAPWKHDKASSPCHLLEAYRTILLEPLAVNKAATKNNSLETPKTTNEATRCNEILFKCKNIWKTKIWKTSSENISDEEIAENWKNISSRSVGYLQAKGIYFRPSSKSLQDITFTSYHFYGILRLPILFIDFETHVLFSNIIAFEMSSLQYIQEGHMFSYIYLMKSLIDTPNDIQELRERGIPCSTLVNAELINIFKDIPTYGLETGVSENFAHTLMAINKHCCSKAKTWMADLSHTYCRSPWAAIAVVTTIFLLCLSFLQTYYTIRPTH